jgi:hypothetical protein
LLAASQKKKKMSQSNLDNQESIADLASYLKQVKTPEDLAALQTVPEFTKKRLQKASKLLDPIQFEIVKNCALANQKFKKNT